MSIVMMSIIGGWTAAFAMFGLLALNESGKLVKIRKGIALRLEASAAAIRMPEESLRPDREKAF